MQGKQRAPKAHSVKQPHIQATLRIQGLLPLSWKNTLPSGHTGPPCKERIALLRVRSDINWGGVFTLGLTVTGSVLKIIVTQKLRILVTPQTMLSHNSAVQTAAAVPREGQQCWGQCCCGLHSLGLRLVPWGDGGCLSWLQPELGVLQREARGYLPMLSLCTPEGGSVCTKTGRTQAVGRHRSGWRQCSR